jgi:mRNA interferase YafQ
MYEIKRGNLFKSSYKRVLSSKSFSIERFEQIIIYLQKNKELPDIFHDHALAGNFIGYRECHISGDCLLIYEINHNDKFVRLYNIGNHTNLFE